jgi:hypothetical protein
VLDGSHTDTAWMFGDARSGEAVRNRTQEEILGYAKLRAA